MPINKFNDNQVYYTFKGWMLKLSMCYSNIDWYDLGILSKIEFFQSKQQDCYITDAALASEMNLHERSIQRRVKKLSDMNLITKETITRTGNEGAGRERVMRLNMNEIDKLLNHKKNEKQQTSMSNNRRSCRKTIDTCVAEQPTMVSQNNRHTCLNNIYINKELNRSRVNNGADAPSLHSQSSNSEFEELSSYLSQYDFENLPNNSLSNIKAWCKQSWEDTSYGDYYEYCFSFDVLSDILAYKSEDLKKTYVKDPSYKFGVLKRILLENYAEFLSKHISRQKEQEEEAIQREADRKTIYYRTDPGAIEAARTRFGTKDDGVLTPEEINAFSLDLEDAM